MQNCEVSKNLWRKREQIVLNGNLGNGQKEDKIAMEFFIYGITWQETTIRSYRYRKSERTEGKKYYILCNIRTKTTATQNGTFRSAHCHIYVRKISQCRCWSTWECGKKENGKDIGNDFSRIVRWIIRLDWNGRTIAITKTRHMHTKRRKDRTNAEKGHRDEQKH